MFVKYKISSKNVLTIDLLVFYFIKKERKNSWQKLQVVKKILNDVMTSVHGRAGFPI